MKPTPKPRPVRALEFNPQAVYTADDMLSAIPTEVAPQNKSTRRPAATPSANGHPPPDADDRIERARKWMAKRDPSVTGQQGDKRLYSTACELVRGFALSDNDALALLIEWNQHNLPPFAEGEIREKIRNARKNGKQPVGSKFTATCEPSNTYQDGPQANGKPPAPDKAQDHQEQEPPAQAGVYEVRTARIALTSNITGRVFDRSRPIIVVRGNYPPQAIMHSVIEAFRASNQGELRFFAGPGGLSYLDLTANEPEITPLNTAGLQLRMSRLLVNWVSVAYHKDSESEKVASASFPKPLAEQMLQLTADELGVPKVNRLVRTPIFSIDGRLMDKTGYYPESYLAIKIPEGLQVPKVSPKPTKDEVSSALSLLVDQLMGESPFVSQSDLANALALLLSFFVREITGRTPLIMVAASTPRTGKGLLIKVLLTVFCGLSLSEEAPRPEVIETGELGKDEEAGKILCSTLLAGPSVVLLDNIDQKVDSPQLAMVLTSSNPSFRLLGSSRMVTVSNNAVWVGSANNPTYSDEISRRVVTIRLDAGMERPEERTGFRIPKILSWARENRPTLIWAVLTLVQNWVAQGRPAGPQVLGGFQPWAETLGGILNCAGVTGFLENRNEVLKKSDPDSQEWIAFFGAWSESFGSARVSTRDLVNIVRRINAPGPIFRANNEQAQLTALGMALNKRDGRVFAGLRLESCGYEQGRKQYRLTPIDTDQAPPWANDEPERASKIPSPTVTRPPQSHSRNGTSKATGDCCTDCLRELPPGQQYRCVECIALAHRSIENLALDAEGHSEIARRSRTEPTAHEIDLNAESGEI